jgi:hypothetical protein
MFHAHLRFLLFNILTCGKRSAFAGAATRLLLLHRTLCAALRALFRLAPAFFCLPALFTFKLSHFVSSYFKLFEFCDYFILSQQNKRIILNK